MALYEVVYIARQDLTAEDVDNLTEKLSKIITDGKGKVISKEYWGLRNLAYKVKKNTRGHYVLLNIESEFSAVAELNRVMGFNEDIIRNVTLRNNFSVEESPLFASTTAKDFKAGKVSKKEDNSRGNSGRISDPIGAIRRKPWHCGRDRDGDQRVGDLQHSDLGGNQRHDAREMGATEGGEEGFYLWRQRSQFHWATCGLPSGPSVYAD